MNFYYDPILGLQYTYLGDLFLIDIEMLPLIEQVLNITEYKL